MMIPKKFKGFIIKKLIPPVAEQFLGPLILFLLTPYIITTLGKINYGLWVLLIAVSMFSQVACLGITAWIAKAISESLALNHFQKVKEIVSSSFALILTIFSALLIGTFIASSFLNGETITATFIMLCVVSGLFNEIDNLFTNATKGYELFHYSFSMEIIGRVFWGATVILGVYTHHLMLFTCFAIVLKALVKYIFFSLFVIRSTIFPLFSFQAFRARYIESRWMFVQLVGGTSLSLFDRLLIPAVLGVNKLASYTPCIQLAQLAFSVPAAANQILMPIFSRYYSLGKFPNKWFAMAITAAVLSALPCLVLFFFSQQILTLWISKSFSDENYMTLNVLSLSYGLLSSLSIFHFIMLGIGESKFVAKVNLFAGAMTMVATAIAANFGVNYIAYAKFIYPLMQLNYLPGILKLWKVNRGVNG
ncbi:polysaccharide biosynthesis family protein [Erwinia sp. AnSW2-5]|uniref:polysaccharide biosynthesis family protein n=1 Tax=Erwinia sp. AnSW2-5 TaxID=3367692 RepID=UPI003857FE95